MQASTYCYSQISAGAGLLCLVEAQLGPAPCYRVGKAEFEAEEESSKAGFLATHAVGTIQPREWRDAGALGGELEGVLVAEWERAPHSVPGSRSQSVTACSFSLRRS